MLQAPKLHEDPTDLARDYWIERARTHPGVQAVHPNLRWGGYHAWTRRMLQEWTLDRLRAERSRYLRCVDLGCGFGDWTEQFAQIAGEVHGCDLSADFVAQTRARVPSARIEHAEIQSYRLPRDVDLVYVGAVLMYLPDDDVLGVLRRIRRVITPTALVIVRDYCTFNLGRPNTVARGGYYSVHRRPEHVRALCERAGLRFAEARSSPSIYAEVMARGIRGLRWPLRALWRLATLPWLRASHTFVFRA
ncbi:MAG: methyltransferase protein [Myxococcales bacterium]|nr:methyltransferase protein [Myxococcales bacterium]